MHALNVPLGSRSYPVIVGSGLLGSADVLAPYISGRQVMVITDETVGPLWTKPLHKSLAGYHVVEQVIPSGEDYKSLETLSIIFDSLAAHHFNRDATIIALGGGMVGDVAGFAAACWQRGIGFVQLPTTLLAQVDAAVGGKTAVNLPSGKNLVGAFHQPRAVIADIATLSTLARKEYCAGIAEIVKYGLALEPALFEWLEEDIELLIDRDPEVVERVVYWCCALKAAIVSEDERESGRRALLNLGHTFGHAIETGAYLGAWLHGEAVSAGLVMASELAVQLGMFDRGSADRVERLLQAAGLPVRPPPIGAGKLKDLMLVDKKITGGKLRFILPEEIGVCTIRDDVSEDAVDAVLALADRQ